MTTLERMAKAAYEKMMSLYTRLTSTSGFINWEDQPQILRDEWVAAVRAALEVIRERPPSPTTPMGKTAMHMTPLDFWQAVIDTILENKS